MLYLTDFFSLGLIGSSQYKLDVEEINPDKVRELILSDESAVSTIHRQAKAMAISAMLELPIPKNPIRINLTSGDGLIFCNLCGTRIPNDAVELPEGTYAQWYLIKVI